MSLFHNALNEICKVHTTIGCRSGLILRDYDEQHAMFKDKLDWIILPLTEIKALEFTDDESED